MYEARRKCGITQKELSELTGFSSSYIYHIENGNRNAPLSVLVKICIVLNISLDKLVFGNSLQTKDSYNNITDILILQLDRILRDPSGEKLRKIISVLVDNYDELS